MTKINKNETLIVSALVLLIVCILAYEFWERATCIRSGGEMGYPEKVENLIDEGSPVEQCLPKR
ncbi:hypothetical protein QZH45_09780 [Pseudomonas corrugata]|uniref:hypothetical protein n=1 Tax=Pseudomonas corrugata TaxID=47879 RepID=UPI003D8166AB